MPSKKKQSKGKSRGAARAQGPQMQYARLLADPCTAPLVAPQYGASDGGYLAKLSSHENFTIGSANTGGNSGQSGYLLWYPDYTGINGGSGTDGSMYVFGASNASTGPANSTTSPLGLGSFGSTNGAFLDDPTRTFVQTSLVQDTRCAAACLKFLYTGRADALSGRVGYLENVPREALLTGTGGPPNVNDMFRYSNASMRTPAHGLENKFRPGNGSDDYRGATLDPCFVQGEAGVAITSIGDGSSSGTGMGFGFVWEGLQDDSSISFDMLKVIEWRPEINSKFVATKATVAPTGGNMVSRSLAFLDRVHPGWERQAYSAITSAITSAGAQKALGYVGETALALLPAGI